MPFSFSLADYARYRDAVGEATYIDISRRTDPARIESLWWNLRQAFDVFGPPWVVQLWTKDPEGVLSVGGDLLRALRDAGTTLVAQVTITGLAGTVWEPHVPPHTSHNLPELVALLGGPEHVKWRYDPIIPSVHCVECFGQLARRIASVGITQGVINFAAPPGRYVRVDRRLAGLLDGWAAGMPAYDEAWRTATARELVTVAEDAGITLACCAEYADLADAVDGLSRAACGDHVWFASLSGRNPVRVASRGSRRGCGCARYYDVGSYGHWSRCHRCAYCYAG